jgi:hypothetical protein
VQVACRDALCLRAFDEIVETMRRPEIGSVVPWQTTRFCLFEPFRRILVAKLG